MINLALLLLLAFSNALPSCTVPKDGTNGTCFVIPNSGSNKDSPIYSLMSVEDHLGVHYYGPIVTRCKECRQFTYENLDFDNEAGHSIKYKSREAMKCQIRCEMVNNVMFTTAHEITNEDIQDAENAAYERKVYFFKTWTATILLVIIMRICIRKAMSLYFNPPESILRLWKKKAPIVVVSDHKEEGIATQEDTEEDDDEIWRTSGKFIDQTK